MLLFYVVSFPGVFSLLYIFAVVVLDRLYDGRQRVLLFYSFACPCSSLSLWRTDFAAAFFECFYIDLFCAAWLSVFLFSVYLFLMLIATRHEARR